MNGVGVEAARSFEADAVAVISEVFGEPIYGGRGWSARWHFQRAEGRVEVILFLESRWKPASGDYRARSVAALLDEGREGGPWGIEGKRNLQIPHDASPEHAIDLLRKYLPTLLWAQPQRAARKEPLSQPRTGGRP